MRGLPPGRYLAVAVQYLERGDSEDPEVLASLRDHASRFTILGTEPVRIELKLVGGER